MCVLQVGSLNTVLNASDYKHRTKITDKLDAFDVLKDLSLSSFMTDSPSKKAPADSTSLAGQCMAANVPASHICSIAAYASGICSENSRDSVILRDVSTNVTC
jgi:hypothetical protein